ncbi:hypothetical protein Syun_007227 [Stephania yunnanensis]|uniref:Uncharacterized protein n=1 Tax=Stephania yunnanensis TaxID=152371 RepID=A0AAP0Q272_9MAGN
MAGESFGSIRIGVLVASSASSQSVRGAGDDRRKKIVRRSWLRDRAQSLGFVAFRPYAAYTAPVLVGPVQSYASALQQLAPSDPQHQYHQRADGRGSGERQGQSSSQVQRQGQRRSSQTAALAGSAAAAARQPSSATQAVTDQEVGQQQRRTSSADGGSPATRRLRTAVPATKKCGNADEEKRCDSDSDMVNGVKERRGDDCSK